MSYSSEPMKSPRLTGAPLRLLAALVERPVVGAPIRRFLLKDSGIDAFRGIEIDEAPTLRPPLPRAGTLDDPPGGPPPDLDALCERLAPGTAGEAGDGDAFRFSSTADFALGYRDGSLDPREVAERVIAAIAESEAALPRLRAILAHRPDDVRRQAEASAARLAAGRPRGPLDGVPVAVKDEVDQEGYPTTVGTAFLGREPATADATAVARLRAAGAVLVGKANMHEIGLGVTGLNLNHGTPRNPYRASRATGGSSSGSAAAVAAGLCPLALGADGGGSIRIPSAFCGVVGLKPTHGRISEHGAAPVCWSVAHLGPIGATALDAALGYAALAGPDPEDPMTAGQPPPHLEGFGEDDLSGLAIGVYRPWFEDADAGVVAACDEMLGQLRGAGAEVREVEIPDLHLLRLTHAITIMTEMASGQWRFYDRFKHRYGPDVRINLALARAMAATDYIHAQRIRRRLCDHVGRVLSDVDVVATPATACTAPPLLPDALAGGESNLPLVDRIVRFARLANLTGSPAISFPAGYDSDGLPVGLHLVGRPWEEHTLLRVAAVAEGLLPRRRPEVFYEVL